MKMDKLLKNTDAMRRANAKFVKVVNYKAGRDKDKRPTAMAKTYTPHKYNLHYHVVNDPDKKRYVSAITFLNPQLDVEVTCSCPDYVFSGAEYNNAQVGASKIRYGNGEPPDATKSDRPSLCKHLVALRALVKERHGF
jgi:hypothetical protein